MSALNAARAVTSGQAAAQRAQTLGSGRNLMRVGSVSPILVFRFSSYDLPIPELCQRCKAACARGRTLFFGYCCWWWCECVCLCVRDGRSVEGRADGVNARG
eukprot:572683-Rhodomonas_salina.2